VLANKPIQLAAETKAKYETIVIKVPDSRRGGSIPDPDIYQYITARDSAEFVLYKRRDGGGLATGGGRESPAASKPVR
jgi:hypothetical protein